MCLGNKYKFTDTFTLTQFSAISNAGEIQGDVNGIQMNFVNVYFILGH